MCSMISNSDINNIHGFVAPGWENVRCVFEQNIVEGLDTGASVCVYHQGQCVVNLYGGWKDVERNKEPYTPDTLQLVFSVSKGIMSAAIALCVERGWLDYDKPVARYWPEFAANGKQNITIGEALSHRAGVPFFDEQLTVDDVCKWSRIISLLEKQKPHWTPGAEHGYHTITTGFIGGELIRRVDPHHRSYGQFLRDELDNEFLMGVSDGEIKARTAPLLQKITGNPPTLPSLSVFIKKALTLNGAFSILPENPNDLTFNKARLHQAEIPAANGITNARALARIYARLMSDINEDGQMEQRLISEKTLLQAIKSATPVNEPDLVLFGLKSDFAQGGFRLFDDFFKASGSCSFGHKGIGGSCALGHASLKLSYAHVCNQLDYSPTVFDQRSVRLLQAIEKILDSQNNSSLSLSHVDRIEQSKQADL
ncbi:unnamed protein product [Rotaria magnacalcarata]|uniref:Beta-lactamase-related domain-containing protein n=2 Tax=Rotaria magnacalcarata TaxID=392030 RepID=A0A816LH60_9BILA|nr:unnamed protein product [Rotaria magnacalcarata]